MSKEMREQIDRVLKWKEYLIKENLNMEYYEHGQCELFALALHKTLGYDMYFFIDNNAEFETDEGFDYGDALVHAYCKDDKGNYFDASGLVTLNDIENDHVEYVDEPEHILVTEKMFYDYIQSGFISKFKMSELNNLETYIKENLSKYVVR
tara:strand:- start:58 stop:510 length:453 start_codon:yes stop_codon:yes gene_type:complete